ncbi:2-amino-4-hydroxy-6-hydroxymethyldihydropteridine diphosphokinase [Gammaproteobacteria bacterium LSUCC0057]|uniref:2-amino-4-hydroxy-6-hydroxymethyldihydropteridine pyrophosphokinase n=1 Tax=Gammaproteobacteria bacterium LSUCC0057 TaxID=2559237 RepID=A0A4Y8UH32_9GAMM|nr:2-amino-4-hydroxy-6-hydroxymethyldihydropteridine diphosphokinase [Gammaproteobacteria bacterium LSUCC0057]
MAARCYIGLGSNLAQPGAQLDRAVATLRSADQIELVALSSYYCSAAIGPGEQPDYQNAVAAIATTLAPLQLLDALQAIENRQGRERSVRWGARTLDLDLLFYDQLQLRSERLQLPHPRICERLFVLQPLAEIAPQLRFADGSSVAEQLAKLLQQGNLKLLSTVS